MLPLHCNYLINKDYEKVFNDGSPYGCNIDS